MKKSLFILGLVLVSVLWSHGVGAAESAFKILAGDVLQITVWKEEGMDREVIVLPDGDITFPLVGTVNVHGLSLVEAQSLVKRKLQKYIPDAAVTVVVKAALGHTVNVTGQVNKPGEVLIGRRMTALQALSQAGGVTPYADRDAIIVIRHGTELDMSIVIPYDDIIAGRSLDKDIVLEPGDVIVVPTSSLF